MQSNLLPSGFSRTSVGSLSGVSNIARSASLHTSLMEYPTLKFLTSQDPTTSLLLGSATQAVPTRKFGTWNVGQRHASAGASSLLALEAQIITLKETIMFLQPMFKDKDNQEASMADDNNSRLSQIHDSKSEVGGLEVSADDFIKLQEEYNKLILTKHQVWCRSFVIPQSFIGLSFQVHNGSKFVLLKVTDNIVGYRFGEFVPTRKVTVHKEAKKKK